MTKICIRCRVEKEVSEFYKSSVNKTGFNSACKVCLRKEQKIYYSNNKEKFKEHNRIWVKNNPEKVKEQHQRWYNKYKKEKLSYSKIWKSNNLDKVSAMALNRRASKLQRTPNWIKEVMKDYMKLMCKFRNSLTKKTGIKYTIDHIIPLRGKLVSGLNVPWNLQLIPGSGKDGNFSKNNKFEPTVENFPPLVK